MRPFEARFTLLDGYDSCERPSVLCEGASGLDPSSLSGASTLLGSSSAADGVLRRAGALLDLGWSASAGASRAASTRYFREAALLDGENPDAWADLAAAHLVVGRIDGSPAEAYHAIEAASVALELDSLSEVAAFNLGLALERAGLVRMAVEGWEAFGVRHGASAWAAEAGRRGGALRRHLTVRPSADPLDSASVATMAAADPEWARTAALDSLLPSWGRGYARDEAEASRSLRVARWLGDALAHGGGDRSVRESVAAIDGLRDPERAAALAGAWAAYGEARRIYGDGRYDAAHAALAGADSILGAEAGPLAWWIRFHRATTRMYLGDPDGAAGDLRVLLLEIDDAIYPALAGRVRWGLATIELRIGHSSSARTGYREAARRFRQAGEASNEAAVRYFAAASELDLGQSWAPLDSLADVARLIGPGRESVWLHNLLFATAEHLASLGLSRAALAVQDEGVEVASRMGRPIYETEARLARSRLLFLIGRQGPAREDLRRADEVLERIEDPLARAWFEVDRDFTAALIDPSLAPREAAARLEEAAGIFGATPNVPRQATALLHAAAAADEAGDRETHREMLEQILVLAERQAEANPGYALRASLARSVREAVRAAVAVELDSGDPGAAFGVLERWNRVRLGQAGHHVAGPHPAPGQAWLSYFLLDGALAAWIRTVDGIDAFRVPVSEARVLGLVEEVRIAASRGAGEAELEPALEALHEVMVGPVLERLDTPADELMVYAEGPLAGVPFPALRDPDTGRYVVEDFRVRQLSDASAAPLPSPLTGGARVVVVGIEEGAPGLGLAPLPASRREAEGVGASYDGALVLTGSAASRERFLGEASGADVVHFAGHAVMDADRPWASHLVLGSAGGTVTTVGVEELLAPLASTRLVVLAACRTASPHQELTDGFTGFADALLSAGVETVVGTIWDVSDVESSELLLRFHALHADGVEPHEALRRAQLSAIASERSPATWAGYRAISR